MSDSDVETRGLHASSRGVQDFSVHIGFWGFRVCGFRLNAKSVL